MTTCPTCGKDDTKLVEEGVIREFYECGNPKCSNFGKRFSNKNLLGHMLSWAPLALSVILLGGAGGDFGGGGHTST